MLSTSRFIIDLCQINLRGRCWKTREEPDEQSMNSYKDANNNNPQREQQ